MVLRAGTERFAVLVDNIDDTEEIVVKPLAPILRHLSVFGGNTILGDANNIGSPDNPGGLYPDFVKIAEGFGVKGRRILNKKDLRPALKEMLAHDGPYVLDVIVPYTNHVLPMIPAGRSVKDMLLE